MLNLGAIEFSLGVNTRALSAATNRIDALGKEASKMQTAINRGFERSIAPVRKVENALLKAGRTLNQLTAKIQSSDLTPKAKTEMITRLNRQFNNLTKGIANVDTAADQTRLDRNFAKWTMEADKLGVEIREDVKAMKDLATAAKQSEAAFTKQANALASAQEKTKNLELSIATSQLSGKQQGALINEADQALRKFKTALQGSEPLKPADFSKAANTYRAEIGNINRKFRQLKSEALAPSVEGFAQLKKALASGGSAMLLINGHLGGMSTRLIALSTLIGNFGIKVGIVAGLVATLGISLGALLRNSFQAALSFEKIDKALTAVTGSAATARLQFGFLVDVSKQAGVEIGGLTSSYTRFLAASQAAGQTLDQTQHQFRQIALATATMGLSIEDTQGTIRAFEQILSKGTVQAEELRGQLGDRLPGAFSIAAKAMGVTTRELGEMLKKGQVISRDFLPKFLDMFLKVNNIDIGEPIDTLSAAVQRAQTNITLFFKAFADNTGLVAASKTLLNTFAEAVESATVNMKEIIRVTAQVTGVVVGAATAWASWAAIMALSGPLLALIKGLGTAITLMRSMATATSILTAAQIALNTAMLANPFGAIASLLGRLAVAVLGAVVGYKTMVGIMGSLDVAFESNSAEVESYIKVQKAAGFQIRSTTQELINQQKVLATQKRQERDAAMSAFTSQLAEYRRIQDYIEENGSGGRGGLALQALGEAGVATNEALQSLGKVSRESETVKRNLKELEDILKLPELGGGADDLEDVADKGKKATDSIKKLVTEFKKVQESLTILDSGPEGLRAFESLSQAREELSDLAEKDLPKVDAMLNAAGFSVGTMEERLAAMILATDKGSEAVDNFVEAWAEIDDVIDNTALLERQVRALLDGMDPEGLDNFERAFQIVKDLNPQGVDALINKLRAMGVTVSSLLPPSEALKEALAGLFNLEDDADEAKSTLEDFEQLISDLSEEAKENQIIMEGMKFGLTDEALERFARSKILIEQWKKVLIAIGLSAEEVAAAIARLKKAMDEASDTDENIQKLEEWGEAGRRTGRILGDFAASVIKDFRNIGDAFKSLVDRLIDLAIEILIIEPIMKAFEGIFRSIGGGGSFSKGGVVEAASGGLISGPGTSTSDSIPARLSDGEYVVNAASVRRIGVSNLDALNSGGSIGGGGDGRIHVFITLSEDLDAKVEAVADQRILVAAPEIVKGSVAAVSRASQRKGTTR